MTGFFGRVRMLSPQGMLWLYLAIVAVTAAVAIAVVLYTSSRVEAQTRTAARQAEASTLASRTSLDLSGPSTVLSETAYAFLESDRVRSLSLEARAGLRATVLGRQESPAVTPPLSSLLVDISDQHALELQTGVHAALHGVDHLLRLGAPGADAGSLAGARDDLEVALDAYIEAKSLSSFRDTLLAVGTLGARLDEAGSGYAIALDGSRSKLAAATDAARISMAAGLAYLAMTMVAATFSVGRLIRRTFETGESERAELRATTATLQYRNDQLNALYNVFAEITDTLSMKYVISATLRETLRVMRASFVTVRLLRGSQLVAAGTLSDAGEEPYLPPVPLGEGPAGRVARRGRTMRIDYGAQEQLGSPGWAERRVESGIIAPLIVGARIVGTLSCWSSQAHAFGEHDERVLEMMASQVATAVLAADTQETLERRALSDPLTNLPNRRRLSEDMAEFARWHKEARSAVVAMMDIDHFKQVNDDFGHKVGDVTLQKIAAVMRQAIRDTDRIYRYGGEEFVLIFPDAGEKEAVMLAERVLKAVAETPLTGEGLEPVGPVTISAGLAILPLHGDEVADLIVLADRALYHAKQAGRNRIEMWREDTGETNAA